MNKSIGLRLLIFFVLLLVSCSRQVIRQSVSEIERPLFLPRKNWQVSFGGGVDRRIYSVDYPWRHNYDLATSRLSIDIDDRTSWFPVVGLQWPSLHFGEKVEWYMPALLRYYFIKNVESIDSVERITGINCAMENGITNLSYSSYDGFNIYTRHTLAVKTMLSKRVWFSSHPGIYLILPLRYSLDTRFEALLRVPVSLGYQITKKWSCKGTVALLGFYDRWVVKGESNSNWKRTVRRYDLDLKIPLQTTYVFSRNWEATFMIEGNVYTQDNSDIASALWFTFTW